MFALADDRSIAAALARHARTARRLRLDVPALIGDAALARAIEASAGARPGVVRVDASPRSGRVLIEYAPDAPVVAELEAMARDPTGPRAARTARVAHPPRASHRIPARASTSPGTPS